MDANQRIGDVERDAAVDALREHMSVGRLTAEEFDERMARALQAKTRSDLDDLFVDLPGGVPSPAVPVPVPVSVPVAEAELPATWRVPNTVAVATVGVIWVVFFIAVAIGGIAWWLFWIPLMATGGLLEGVTFKGRKKPEEAG